MNYFEKEVGIELNCAKFGNLKALNETLRNFGVSDPRMRFVYLSIDEAEKHKPDSRLCCASKFSLRAPHSVEPAV